MNCTLIFKIGDEEIPVSISLGSASYPTNEQILKALQLKKNQKSLDALKNIIQEKYTQNKSHSVNVSDLIGKPLVGNRTVRDLAAQFTNVSFPEGIDAEVLFVKRAKIGGITMSGRCINSNGKEVFIVTNDRGDLYKLAGFLTNRKVLEDNPTYFDESSASYDGLEILRKKLNKNSIPELILDYLEVERGDNIYRTTYFTDSKGKVILAYDFLDRITRDIRNRNQVTQYADSFVNSINRLKHAREEDTNKTLIGLDYKELYSAIEAHYPDLLSKLNIKDFKGFRQKILSKDFDKSLFNTVIEDKPLIYTLLSELIKVEPKFAYDIHSVGDKEIILSYRFSTLKSLYGFVYPTSRIPDLLNEDCNGYKIYSYSVKEGRKNKTLYTYSREYITENTPIYGEFNTQEEAENAAKERALKEKLKYFSYLKFKHRNLVKGEYDSAKYIYAIENSSQVYTPGTIVTVLSIPIDTNMKINNSVENDLLKKKITKNGFERWATTKDVHDLINTWEIDEHFKRQIIDNLDNAEKAAAFLYKINERLQGNRTDGQELVTISEEIKNAEVVNYYIHTQNNGSNYTLIPTDPNMVENYKKDRRAPILPALNAMQDILGERTGVQVSLMTSKEISEAFPIGRFPSIDPNTSKAFIYNGEIYINTTIASGEDLLHEYTHIMLGVLKSNPETREHYEQILRTVLNEMQKTNKGRKELENIKKVYAGLTQIDQLEELFVKKFSEYVLGNVDPTSIKELSSIFKQEEEFLKAGITPIFDLVGGESLSTIYTRSMKIMFSKFSHDIATKLEEGNGLNLDEITESRRVSKWIADQIEKENIIEDCGI